MVGYAVHQKTVVAKASTAIAVMRDARSVGREVAIETKFYHHDDICVNSQIRAWQIRANGGRRYGVLRRKSAVPIRTTVPTRVGAGDALVADDVATDAGSAQIP
jgi:hypothetical protein